MDQEIDCFFFSFFFFPTHTVFVSLSAVLFCVVKVEEGHTLQQLVHLWCIFSRHADLFYQFRNQVDWAPYRRSDWFMSVCAAHRELADAPGHPAEPQHRHEKAGHFWITAALSYYVTYAVTGDDPAHHQLGSTISWRGFAHLCLFMLYSICYVCVRVCVFR